MREGRHGKNKKGRENGGGGYEPFHEDLQGAKTISRESGRGSGTQGPRSKYGVQPITERSRQCEQYVNLPEAGRLLCGNYGLDWSVER